MQARGWSAASSPRAVSMGLSARNVPPPINIAPWHLPMPALISCTRTRESLLLIQRDLPLRVAMRPSRVEASLSKM